MPVANLSPILEIPLEIAIICALRTESDAVEAIFDQFYEEVNYVKASGDQNSYSLGRIGRHNVVLAYMPGIGKTASATVAASFCAPRENVIGFEMEAAGVWDVPTSPPSSSKG